MPSNPSLRTQLPRLASQDEPIRILLVICRPKEKVDVPFRSVASRLVKGLSQAEQAFFQLEVLRPPTFGQLSQVLRAARDAGKPFHVVHFDGHGSYLGIDDRVLTSSVTFGPNELLLSPRRDDHKHGYLVFENPAVKENQQLEVGESEQTFSHWRESIRYAEMAGDIYHAGIARHNVAIALAQANSLPDALEYARAALRNFQSYPQGAEEMIQRTEGLIKEIEQDLTDYKD